MTSNDEATAFKMKPTIIVSRGTYLKPKHQQLQVLGQKSFRAIKGTFIENQDIDSRNLTESVTPINDHNHSFIIEQ